MWGDAQFFDIRKHDSLLEEDDETDCHFSARDKQQLY